MAETANFSVWSRLTHHETVGLARRCEELRAALTAEHLGNSNASPWSPKCAVVVHANIQEYARVLGRERDASAGCTTVTCDDGRVVFRRVDLRGDSPEWQTNALPHELTHVVLADRFLDQRLPWWLDEGLAMLGESRELQQRRLAVLHAARSAGAVPSLVELLKPETPQRFRGDVNLRYAMSLSLVRFLEDQGDAGRLLTFAERTLRTGPDAALRDSYGMAGGTAELERRWREHVARHDAGTHPDSRP